jgi:hypothetical protein
MPGSNRGILAEKLKELDVASKDWKRRVGPKDAVDFSVAGRMGVEAVAPPSPLLTPSREKKTPKPARFKSKKGRIFQSLLGGRQINGLWPTFGWLINLVDHLQS